MLSYRGRKYFEEGSEFYFYYNGPMADSLFTLSQFLRYDNPRMMDEQYIHGLAFKIIDTTAAKQKKTLTLEIDTAIIKAYYGLTHFLSYLNPKTYEPTGELTILKWTSESIDVKENIIVRDKELDKPVFFKGRRTFLRNRDMEKSFQSR
jgi:hypothetical protein